jgi:uncharacterized protein YndB with AHSA1/START domain
MKSKSKKLEIKVERTIPASPREVFDGWLNPKVPGNPWYEGNKVIFNPKVDGLFYWYISKTPHYGRFTKIKRGAQIQHTWMSPYTLGEESMVTVTFKKRGKDTLMTLIHTGLPNNEGGRGHEEGWSYFLDKVVRRFKKVLRKKK